MPEPAELEAELIAWLAREIFDSSIELSPQTDLLAAGFDSMSLVRLLVFIEEKYGTQVAEDEVTEEVLRDVRSLAPFLAELIGSGS